MQILCVDLGNDSIKFLAGNLERRKFSVTFFEDRGVSQEGQGDGQGEGPKNPFDGQFRVVKQYIEDHQFSGKLIVSFPSALMMTRYFELPALNRKKVEQMIPFQLESGLPMPLSDVHYTFSIFKGQGKSFAQAFVARDEVFQAFCESFRSHGLSPSLLSPAQNFWQNSLSSLSLPPSCLMIDLGHETLNAYHIIDGHIVLNHISFFGGRAVDQFLADELNISLEEAQGLKNGPGPLWAQEGLSLKLKELFLPMMKEIKRWTIAHRVKFKSKVEAIYLTGLGGNFEGFAEFIEENFKIPTSFVGGKRFSFPIPSKLNVAQYGTCLAMAQSQASKMPLANFLMGKYRPHVQNTIRPEGSAFVLTRAVGILAILGPLLLLERFLFLHPSLRTIQGEARKSVKSASSGVAKKDQRKIRRLPEEVLKVINKNKESAQKDYQQLKEVSSGHGWASIFKLSENIGKNDHIQVEEFTYGPEGSSALVAGTTVNEVERLEKYLSNLKSFPVKVKRQESKLRITFEDNP